MQIMSGFQVAPVIESAVINQPDLAHQVARVDCSSFVSVGEPLTTDDVCALTMTGYSRSLSRWAYKLAEQGHPLMLQERPLDVRLIGPTMAELLIAESVLAFNVPADLIMPRSAVGRVVLMDYQPKRRIDPPVPLLSLLELTPAATGYHNSAIHNVLARHDASGVADAIRLVLREGIAMKMTREEAFFYLVKMLSLVTGAYTARLDTAHVE